MPTIAARAPERCRLRHGAGPTTNAGIFELYRRMAEELRRGDGGQGRLVRLHATAGVGAVQTLSGLHLNVATDGTVGMSVSDATPLLRAGWRRVEERELSK